MSAMTDYIHYHYNNYSQKNTPAENASFLASRYNKHRIQSQYKLSIEDLNKKLKTIYLSKIQDTENPMGEDEFFKLLEDMKDNVLSKAATKMVNNISTTNLGRQDIAAGSKNVVELQKIIDTFEKILTQITGSTFSDNPIPILTNELLKGDTSISNIKKVYRDAYLTDGTVFKVDTKYSRAIVSHKNEINKMLASLSAIKNIQQGGMRNFDSSIQSQTISAFIWSIYFTLNRIVGFVSEDKIVEYIPEYLTEYLQKEFSNISNIHVSASGTKSSSIFNVQTEDIAIAIDMEKMLNGKNGTIKVKLPGASLKRTNIKKNNMAKIHIKTNAQLAKFLDNANFSNQDLSNFYQAYSTYNMSIITKLQNQKERKMPAQLNRTAKDAMEDMYTYFHATILPMALGGSLTSDDFAYFIIINDKVFNIVEIIQKIANSNDYSFVESNISVMQTSVKNMHNKYYQVEKNPDSNIEGESRSSLILNDIRKRNITMQLNLALNKLTN